MSLYSDLNEVLTPYAHRIKGLKIDLDAQVADVKDELKEDTITKDIEYTLISGEYIKYASGEIAEDNTYSRTDYVDISDGNTVILTWDDHAGNTTLNALCFFDENKTYITGVSNVLRVSDESSNINRPVNAKYCIFSGKTQSMNLVLMSIAGIQTPISKIWDAFEKKANINSEFNFDFVPQKTLLQNVIGVTKYPNNLCDYNEFINNAFIEYQTGNIHPNSSNYYCTGYIPVVSGTEYKSNIGRNYAWYTTNKEFISGESGTGIQSGITAPENASFIRFTVNKTTDNSINPSDVYFTDLLSYNTDVHIPNLIAISNTYSWCNGKTINWIGDSIVDGSDFDEVVCNALGLTKLTTDGVDGGINGSTIALKADGTDGRNALCLRYSDMPNNADIIAVSCGTNDFQYAWCPIGDIESASNSTFYGALKTLCEGLINKYPQKLIFFTTPIKRAQVFENGNGGEYTADEVMTTPFSKNKYGKTLGDYADIIKEVCGYYSIPVLDMYRESLLNPQLASQQNLFDNALTHPNTAGQKIMARRIAGWITQLGYLIE